MNLDGNIIQKKTNQSFDQTSKDTARDHGSMESEGGFREKLEKHCTKGAEQESKAPKDQPEETPTAQVNAPAPAKDATDDEVAINVPHFLQVVQKQAGPVEVNQLVASDIQVEAAAVVVIKPKVDTAQILIPTNNIPQTQVKAPVIKDIAKAVSSEATAIADIDPATTTVDELSAIDQKISELTNNNKNQPAPNIKVNSEELKSKIAAQLDNTKKDIVPEINKTFEAAKMEMVKDIQQTATSRDSVVLTERSHILDKTWSKNLSSKIALHASNSVTSMKININPISMGPIEISVSSNNESMSISMLVVNPATKDLLDSNLDKLQKDLEDAGLNLSGFDINQQSDQESREDMPENEYGGFNSDYDDHDTLQAGDDAMVLRATVGLIDSYA